MVINLASLQDKVDENFGLQFISPVDKRCKTETNIDTKLCISI